MRESDVLCNVLTLGSMVNKILTLTSNFLRSQERDKLKTCTTSYAVRNKNRSVYSSQSVTEQFGALQIGKPRSQELATTLCDRRARRQMRSAGATYSFTGTVAA